MNTEKKEKVVIIGGGIAGLAAGTYALLSTRGFILSDKDGNPDYFGGIIIRK